MTTTLIVSDPADAVSAAQTNSPTPIAENPLRRGPVLLALHGREGSNATISAARLIADRLELELLVVTVASAELKYARPFDLIPDPRTRQREFDVAHEGHIRAALRRSLGFDPPCTIDVRHGRPAREIVRAAKEMDATMIIVDAAPRRGIRHTRSGVRALEILRRARCPVLSVSAPFPRLARSIVAAVDFSPASIRATQAALLLADDNAALTMLHFPMPLYPERPFRDVTGALIGADIGKSFERLRTELDAYSPPGLIVTTHVLQGSVVAGVVATVNTSHADLVAVGTHGPKRIERFFVGSTAASLLHRAPCVVLACPAPSGAERDRLELLISDTTVTDELKHGGANVHSDDDA